MTTAAVAMMAVPALAADVVYEEPPAPAAQPMEVAPVSSWAGPYAGVSLGYGFNGDTDTTGGGTVDTDGFLGGAFAGYNLQSGNLVYGVEGDVGYSGVDGTNAAGTTSESGVEGSLRGRVGVAATPDVLIYGTGGGAAENHEIADAAGSDDNTLYGYTVGAGVDTKLTQNVFGRVEYRYTDYNDKTFNTGSGAQEVDASNNRVSVGLGMKF